MPVFEQHDKCSKTGILLEYYFNILGIKYGFIDRYLMMGGL